MQEKMQELAYGATMGGIFTGADWSVLILARVDPADQMSPRTPTIARQPDELKWIFYR